MTHLTFEQINDIADGKRTADNGLAEHVTQCDVCGEQVRRVRELVDAARALPREIAPPPEAWRTLQSRLGDGRKPARQTRASRWVYGGWMAAAAVLVLVVGMTLLEPARRNNKVKGSKLPPATATATSSSMHVLAVEKNYAATVAELRQTLEAQRSTLSPNTIAVLERSMAAIDGAIAEARAALADDPANQMLVGILSANYERKVELLQRVTELSPSS